MPEVWYYTKLREYERELRKKQKETEKQNKEIEELKRKLEEERERRKRAEDELARYINAKQAKKPKFPDYSLSRQEKLRDLKKAFKSPGRIPKEEKISKVNREEDVYPEGISPDECVLAYTRIVTHICEGSKEIVLYRIYRKGRKKGKLPHVMPKGEYGAEVAVILAFLVYTIGLSQDQAAQILSFFCGLEIKSSQAESLLNQIGQQWKKEFEKLCNLILFAFVVHIDETGWKEGAKNCYAWIFKSLSHTVLLYGKKRNEEALDSVLPREQFKGIGITDCYKIYENYFCISQKCWAHFLRKIIKLMLLNPDKKEYMTFFEKLYRLFKKGKKIKENKKLTKRQKEKEAEKLKKKVIRLCSEKDTKMNKDTPKDRREFVNLHKNLIRNTDSLFIYALYDEVEPTNNRAEQGLRFTAKARNNYQTSKTSKGSERRSVIASVMASLKQNLSEFSLKSVTEEIMRWQSAGKSLFQEQLEQLQAQGASP